MLSREQLQQNINAMEKQGASPAEIQQYLNSLKNAPQTAPATQEKPGLVQSVVQDVASPFVRAASGFAPLIETLQGKSQAEIAKKNVEGRDFGYLGHNVKPLGYQASEHELGQRGIASSMLGMVKDTAGAGLQAASTILPAAKVPTGLAALKGGGVASKIITGGIQTGLTGLYSGAMHGLGTGLQDENMSAKDVAIRTAGEGIVGGVGGAVLGMALPGAVALRGAKTALKPADLMTQVAKANPSKISTFSKMSGGKTPGEYLTERGIYGNTEEVIAKLGERFQYSRNLADTEIAKLPGFYKPEPVKTSLDLMLERELRISSPGAPSKDLSKVQELFDKYQKDGLTMSEINEVKRIFERNNKLDYLRQNLPESVAKANALDNGIRSWQFEKAKYLGLENLDEINKETQLARFLGDAVLEKNLRQGGNNSLGLIDAVLLSGGSPQSIAMLLTKKAVGSGAVKSSLAKAFGGQPTVGLPQAKVRPGISDPAQLLGPGAIPLNKPTTYGY